MGKKHTRPRRRSRERLAPTPRTRKGTRRPGSRENLATALWTRRGRSRPGSKEHQEPEEGGAEQGTMNAGIDAKNQKREEQAKEQRVPDGRIEDKKRRSRPNN